MVTGTLVGTRDGWCTFPWSVSLSHIARDQWPVEVSNSTDDTAATSEWSPCNGPRVPCEHCRLCDDTVYKRRQNTAFHDDAQNYAVLCSDCQIEADAMWQDQWDEYNSGRL
jgi:hypothetical protein